MLSSTSRLSRIQLNKREHNFLFSISYFVWFHVYKPVADALKTMSVTMNPWHCDCFAKELKDLLGNNLLTEKCEIKESSMRDQVKR